MSSWRKTAFYKGRNGLNAQLKHLIGRLESRALLIWFAVAGALWAFLVLANEIGEGETGAIDKNLILLLRVPGHPGQPLGPLWFNDAMRDVTALGGFVFLVLFTLAFVLALVFHGKRREATVMAAIAMTAQASIDILKFLYDRPRPDFMAIQAYSASFPSGHTTESTAVFLTAATIIATLEIRSDAKILAYGVAGFVMLSVGFSRVYLGMHWPTDVLGGWVLGSAWAMLAWIALRANTQPPPLPPAP